MIYYSTVTSSLENPMSKCELNNTCLISAHNIPSTFGDELTVFWLTIPNVHLNIIFAKAQTSWPVSSFPKSYQKHLR